MANNGPFFLLLFVSAAPEKTMATKECLHSGLDLFSFPALHTAIEDSEYVEHRPLAALGADGPVEFVVSGGAPYLDLANSYLRVKVKVVQPNGDNLAADAKVCPVNLTLHSMWSDLTLFVGGVEVSNCSGAYPYLAYLQTLLTYGRDAKQSHLQASMWYHDSASHFNSMAELENAGVRHRKARTAESNVVDMVGRLHSDLFHQSKFLLNHLDVRVKLTRSKDAFVLMRGAAVPPADPIDFKLQLLDASLFVRKVTVNPAIVLAHEKTLMQHNAKYPMTKSVMRIYTAPAQSMNFSVDNMFLDHLPTRLVLGFVKAKAYNGDYTENPFLFLNCNITNLCLHHQGKQIPTRGLQPNFTTKEYTRSYMTLFNGTNTAWTDSSCSVSWSDYAGGYTLWCFDLTNSLSHAPEATEVTRAGPLRFECKFEKALEEAHNLIVYAEFQSHIQISRSREVLVL